MATTIASRKARGMLLQKKIVEMILETYPELTANDVRSVPGSVPGNDIWLSERASQLFDFAVEAKNQESLSIWAALEQAEDPKRKGVPLLVFKRNRSKIYACLEFETFLKLIKSDRHCYV